LLCLGNFVFDSCVYVYNVSKIIIIRIKKIFEESQTKAWH